MYSLESDRSFQHMPMYHLLWRFLNTKYSENIVFVCVFL